MVGASASVPVNSRTVRHKTEIFIESYLFARTRVELISAPQKTHFGSTEYFMKLTSLVLISGIFPCMGLLEKLIF